MTQGSRLGRYEILSRLAVGGMAELWLARMSGAEGFEKKVVVKTMLPHLAGERDFVKMFVNEAALAARLSHANIVQVFDFGELDGRYFIAMEHIAGRSLRQVQHRLLEQRRRLPAWLLLRAVAGACEALHYAHGMGVLHRDVSPENIMLSFTGSVKVIDFGVAQGDHRDRARHLGRSGQTGQTGKTGPVIGKYGYLSPERVQGEPGEPRSDIYSLGVVLYEYLTGSPPFRGEDMAALCQIMEGRAPDPRDLDPHIPDELVRITKKAMARDPEDRYRETAHLAAELSRFLAVQHEKDALPDLSLYLCSIFSECTEIPAGIRAQLARRQVDDPALVEADLLTVPDPDVGMEDLSSQELVELSVDVEVDDVPEKDEGNVATCVFDLRPPPPPATGPGDIFSCYRASSTRSVPIDIFGTSRRPIDPPPPPQAEPRPGPAQGPEQVAAERFDRGLELVRKRSYEPALLEWAHAAELEPTNRTYRINLKRLRERISACTTAKRSEHGHQK